MEDCIRLSDDRPRKRSPRPRCVSPRPGDPDALQQWCATKEEAIRAESVASNQDDISALVHTAAREAELAQASAVRPAAISRPAPSRMTWSAREAGTTRHSIFQIGILVSWTEHQHVPTRTT